MKYCKLYLFLIFKLTVVGTTPIETNINTIVKTLQTNQKLKRNVNQKHKVIYLPTYG